jgi:CheY-like chemotaxis protein
VQNNASPQRIAFLERCVIIDTEVQRFLSDNSKLPEVLMDQSSLPLIVIVDDEHSIRTLFADAFESIGCRVMAFMGPCTALESFKYWFGEVRHIITDIDMNEMNGLEFVSYLQQDLGVSIPITVCSGRDPDLVPPGSYSFQQKPPRDLLAFVERIARSLK